MEESRYKSADMLPTKPPLERWQERLQRTRSPFEQCEYLGTLKAAEAMAIGSGDLILRSHEMIRRSKELKSSS